MCGFKNLNYSFADYLNNIVDRDQFRINVTLILQLTQFIRWRSFTQQAGKCQLPITKLVYYNHVQILK